MPKRTSLFMRLFLNYSVIIIISFLIFILVYIFLFHNQLYTGYENTYKHQENVVEQQLNVANDYNWSDEEVQMSLANILDQEDYLLYIIDEEKNILYQPDSSSERILSLPDGLLDELSNDEVVTRGGRFDGQLRYVAAGRLDIENGELQDNVLVMVSRDLSHTYQQVIVMIISTLLITLLIAGIILWFMSKKITKPISEMDRVAKSYAKGDFKTSVNYRSNDEIGQLAKTLDNMAHELNHLDERRKEFIANVSHDLRSPLTSIKGFLIALEDGTIPDASRSKYYGLMKEETDRMIKLVNDTLDMTQLEEGKYTLDETQYNLLQQVENIISKCEPQLQKKNLTVEVIALADDYYVYADRDKIAQVFINLLQNAVQFSHDQDKIIIDIYEKEQKVYCSITDHGEGIPTEDIDSIWKRFYKVDVARSSRSGVGIGLAIVKSIIDLHNGDISVKSTKGEGTTFTFSLNKNS